MPQLDVIIFSSQTLFILFFLVGYFLFLKYILPFIAFELKLKQLLELQYLNWFNSNLNRLISLDKINLELLTFVNSLFRTLNSIVLPKKIIYSLIYSYDLLVYRSIYRRRTESRNF